MSESFSNISGGCQCSAIRYTIRIPSEDKRPIILSAKDSNGQGDIALPQTGICFCNDCRRASGNLVTSVLLIPFEWVTFSVIDRSSGSSGEQTTFAASDRFPLPVDVAVGGQYELPDTYFNTYQSSGSATRSFCSVSPRHVHQ